MSVTEFLWKKWAEHLLSKRVWLLVAVAAIPAIFRGPWETYVINPLRAGLNNLSLFEESWIFECSVGFIFLLNLLVLLRRLSIKYHYAVWQFSLNLIIPIWYFQSELPRAVPSGGGLLYLSVCIYIYFQVIGWVLMAWQHLLDYKLERSTIDRIKNWFGATPGPFSRCVLSLISVWLYQPRQGQNSNGFSYDTRVNNSQDDKYGRSPYAREIASKILYTKNPEQSFAVGIAGRWGSGKTSFLALIEEHLKEKGYEDELIIISFNPWQFDESASLVEDFFTVLKSKLKRYSAELGSQVSNYADTLLSLDTNLITKFSRVGLSSISKEKTLDELYEDISNTIRRLDKQIVLFIDDLDRLEAAEITQVIRLIRNTANFPNVVYVVAYDRDYVANAISKNINDHQANIYLEKIFQLEVNLPVIVKGHVESHLQNRLVEELSINLQDAAFTKAIHTASKIIINIREANRFLNAFGLIHQLLRTEVNLYDLLIVEAIRSKFPRAYRLLYEQKAKVLTLKTRNSKQEQGSITLQKVDITNGYSLTSEEIAGDILEKELRKVGIQESAISTIKEVLLEVFTGEVNSPVSISHPAHFDKYFAYQLLPHNISEIKFSSLRRDNSYEKFGRQISIWIKENKGEDVVSRFRAFTHANDFQEGKEDFDFIVRVFYGELIAKYNLATPYDLDRFFHLEGLNGHVFQDDSSHSDYIIDFIERISEAEPFENSIDYIRLHNAKYKNSDKLLSAEEKFFILKRFSLRIGHGSKQVGIRLVRMLILVLSETEELRSVESDNSVQSRLLEYIEKKLPEEFFLSLISDIYEDTEFYVIDRLSSPDSAQAIIIKYLYGTVEDYRERLSELSVEYNSSKLREAVSFLDKYIANEYEATIFEFRELGSLVKGKS